MEHRGYLRLCDRKKDMMLVGAENVYSVEVENAVTNHMDIRYACVIGVPDLAMGEIPKAFVVLQPGAAKLSTAQIQRHCRALIAEYKVPRVVEFMTMEEIPMTGSGKVAKAALRKRENERRAARAQRSKDLKALASASANKASTAAATVAATATAATAMRWEAWTAASGPTTTWTPTGATTWRRLTSTRGY